jgi:DNA-directed RNA polymerase subunit RPC12/RpoP
VDLAAYGATNANELYARCPHCTYSAPPAAIDFVALPGISENPDEGHPVTVRCTICDHQFDGRGRWVRADTQTTCTRCGARFAAPTPAVRARCTSCGVLNLGPAVPPDQQRRRFDR